MMPNLREEEHLMFERVRNRARKIEQRHGLTHLLKQDFNSVFGYRKVQCVFRTIWYTYETTVVTHYGSDRVRMG